MTPVPGMKLRRNGLVSCCTQIFGKTPGLAGSWDLNKLPTLLRAGLTGRGGRELPGVTQPMLYVGMWRALFGWHTEDMELNSINFLHHGAPKLWYCVPPKYASRFESLAAGMFPEDANSCKEFLRHKGVTISPTALAKAGIPVQRCIQRAGEFMLTFPRAYHAGFNAGFNVAESVNFASFRWLEFGRCAKSCSCEQYSVRIDVDEMVSRVQQAAPDLMRDSRPALGDTILVRWAPQQPQECHQQPTAGGEVKDQQQRVDAATDEGWYRCIVCRPHGSVNLSTLVVKSADRRFAGVFDFEPELDEWRRVPSSKKRAIGTPSKTSSRRRKKKR